MPRRGSTSRRLRASLESAGFDVAGDWIKLELVTPDKPEVHAMAADLNIEPEHILGCLCRIWIWADEQSLNGHAVGVTEKALDRVTRVSGFAKAMRTAGWLSGQDGALTFPNFGYHNGKSAKSRSLATRRKQVERVAKESRIQRDGNATREEKRRDTHIVPIGFAQLWAAYPRKTARAAAMRSFSKLNPDNVLIASILVALDRQKRSDQWIRDGGKFVPHAATWLNGRRWEDEETPRREPAFPI